jgi:hypothetical protein
VECGIRHAKDFVSLSALTHSKETCEYKILILIFCAYDGILFVFQAIIPARKIINEATVLYIMVENVSHDFLLNT